MVPSARIALLAFSLLSLALAQYGAMQIPDGLSPRYYLAGSQLDRRQSNGNCDSGFHSCLDVNSTSCCPDTHFCFINSTFGASCCPFGSNCGYTACDTLHYQCSQTTTSNGVATEIAACCPRSCTSTSAYKCPSAYGGNCCSFGSICATNNQCVSTAASTTALVSEIPAGCTATTQIACPSSLGGGCCANTESCMVLNNINYCSAVSVMATRTGSNGVVATLSPKKGTGLSTGAKAGIGAGIAVVVCLIVAGLLWFCLAQRRKARLSEGQISLPAMSQPSESERPHPFRQASDYFGPQATAGPFTQDDNAPSSRPRNTSGVPISPDTPSDVIIPVEIDSSKSNSNVTSPGNFTPLNFTPQRSHGRSDTPAELP